MAKPDAPAPSSQEQIDYAIRRGEAEKLKIPLLDRPVLQQLVRDILSGQVITSEQVATDMWSTVFLPILFGGLAAPNTGEFPVPVSDLGDEAYRAYTTTRLQDLGVVYEHISEASPRSINGYPIFFSMKLLHVDDWSRVKAAVIREQQRRAAGEDLDV